jgi:large subunit ribosomal protein L35
MQKTKKSVAKRFKLSGTGKLMHRSPGTRHLLAHKSSKRKRRLGQSRRSPTDTPRAEKCLPFGL